MSKISKIQASLDRVKGYLYEQEVSFILFNNDSRILSTKHGETHDNIFNAIKDIQCQGTTDFGSIKDKLEILDSSNDTTVSIIVSDGYHTDMKFSIQNSVDMIKLSLHKKFDYSIGIGECFDEELLSAIGKVCIINNSNKTFDFLFRENDSNSFIIPKNIFFFTDTDYTETTTEEDVSVDVLEESVSSFPYTRVTIRNGDNTRQQKKHYIFCIDYSGSMDDSFMHDDMINRDESNQYHFQKFIKDTKIQFPFIPKSGSNLYIENKDAKEKQEFQHTDKLLSWATQQKISSIESWEDMDTYIACKSLYLIENMKEIKERNKCLYNLTNYNFNISKVKLFIKEKYKELLSPSERIMNILLHTPIDKIYMNNDKIIPDSCLDNVCSICCINKIEILFSCNHALCCFQCALHLIERNDNSHLICPIDRIKCNWLRYICFRNNSDHSRLCLQCSVNLCDIYQNPCSHVLFCVDCCRSSTLDDNYNCELCQEKIISNHKIIFP